MKKIVLVLMVLLASCQSQESKIKESIAKEVKKEISSDVTGKWISINDYIVKDIIISNVDSEMYNFKITFKDGGIKNTRTELNNSGEYHTNNRFGEYYKLDDKTLGVYDNQGLIAQYKR